MRLIVIDLVVILRSIWARYIVVISAFMRAHINLGWVRASHVFSQSWVIRQNDLPTIYDWCARATFYRTLLSVQGIKTAVELGITLKYAKNNKKSAIESNSNKESKVDYSRVE